ncbi:hypothetical protein QBC38DRAFT_547986 [Podospora fimiseda]|uniref:Uncharacterized protein n=1 Tax=Podospora fimiseda TaxID=252190 RepID=A0AAN7BIK7_9PEZI|nr:hypothetical protein QBC38DRAFT_547986 [Podospora fimiseda]
MSSGLKRFVSAPPSQMATNIDDLYSQVLSIRRLPKDPNRRAARLLRKELKRKELQFFVDKDGHMAPINKPPGVKRLRHVCDWIITEFPFGPRFPTELAPAIILTTDEGKTMYLTDPREHDGTYTRLDRIRHRNHEEENNERQVCESDIRYADNQLAKGWIEQNTSQMPTVKSGLVQGQPQSIQHQVRGHSQLFDHSQTGQAKIEQLEQKHQKQSQNTNITPSSPTNKSKIEKGISRGQVCDRNETSKSAAPQNTLDDEFNATRPSGLAEIGSFLRKRRAQSRKHEWLRVENGTTKKRREIRISNRRIAREWIELKWRTGKGRTHEGGREKMDGHGLR